MYKDACTKRQWTVVAREYLLHLIGYTIFADKSATSVSVSYLGLFVDLRHTGGYSWVAAALTHMYEQLGDCSYANNRQLAGYVTLLASWIYEHFPSIGHRQLRDDYVEDEPRCMKYVIGSRLSTLDMSCIEHRHFRTLENNIIGEV
ncbi:protein MAIN-LIKE 1-like [Phaseolus vulgaris]|uniref:protein MAIN-LIKE 1-like n=1 Tax=Phaseolus vulgaris TaxID=3885 RepID=UPI0035CA42B4